jgi:myosin heavy subunit
MAALASRRSSLSELVNEATASSKKLLQSIGGGGSSTVGHDDMIQLPDLVDGALLGNLEKRFLAEIVYTYIGDIVVSVNPFKLTGNAAPHVQQQYVEHFKARGNQSALPPHIFMLVGQAYSTMRDGAAKSLSILISGESGAGKTEAMKLCVSHLGALSMVAGGGGSSGSGDPEGNVAVRLMKTNPIMEPIGNAKTVRNNNSSRFGKHFDIQFNASSRIIGAATSTYLLEKPRITEHMKGERNYHVFYMLCKAPDSIRQFGKLGDWDSYSVLSQAGTVERVTTWNDEQEFVKLHEALHELGFTHDQRGQLYAMISIVLQLGNVRFADGGGAGGEPRAV